ncbi:hypothetical protein RJ640_005082 [Escallonia rubra]|uniref:Uncharacterized protein n=1 Tax=Escallonia rubra TaxID=112253 RepID=A0AA88UEB9_9ASTE|nr:hypothetical protein RJ640_005082 [Escallonia rubra]
MTAKYKPGSSLERRSFTSIQVTFAHQHPRPEGLTGTTNYIDRTMDQVLEYSEQNIGKVGSLGVRWVNRMVTGCSSLTYNCNFPTSHGCGTLSNGERDMPVREYHRKYGINECSSVLDLSMKYMNQSLKKGNGKGKEKDPSTRNR